MAYSNWGAFIYNKEKDITDKCGDRTYIFKNKKWTLVGEDEDYDENLKRVGAHAVLPLTDNLLIECYKTYIQLHTQNDTINITNEVLGESAYRYENFIITGYYLNKNENVIKLTISKDGERAIYCIIFGMSVGKGYETTPISKYIKKHLYYNEERQYYTWDEPEIADYAIEKAERQYEIKHIKYWLFHSHIPALLKQILHLNFCNLDFELDEIKEDLKKIRYLK